VLGLYSDRSNLQEAIGLLRSARFRSSDVSVLIPGDQKSTDLAIENETQTGVVKATDSDSSGLFGWQAENHPLTVEGAGPAVAEELKSSAPPHRGSGLDALADGLIALGVPEFEAKKYETRVREGRILLSVHCNTQDWAERAMQALKNSGAEEIYTADEKKHGAATSR
jgi:hypothetical protein